MKNLTTASGKVVFPVGIGTWGIGGTWDAERDDDDAGVAAIRYSVSTGQNHIDTAQAYGAGHTDEVVGKAISTLTREDLFVADKLWETNVAKGTVEPAVQAMLSKLDTDYLDMLYIHKAWDDKPWREAIPQIDELIDKGLVRHFAVSNFALPQLKEAAKLSKHPVAANQIHYSVLHKQELTDEMKRFCEDNGVRIVAYRPLERGDVFKNRSVQSVAKAHGVSCAEVAIAWLLAQGALVVTKSVTEESISQNVAATHLQLTPAELKQLESI